MSSNRIRLLAAGAVTAAAVTAVVSAGGPAAQAVPASGCSDVEVVFARGSGEMPGLGITGTPLVSGLSSQLEGRSVTSYAVQYAAAYDQSSAGAGATDMTEHVVEQAQACPDTQFVLGGYSQGASVTDIALGIPTTLGRGSAIPDELAPRVAAVVVFGNPLGLSRQTIEDSSELYGGKAKSYCNTGDPVCGGGANSLAHLTYASNGSVSDAAQFAAGKVSAEG
ncbi:cutinase family protein [Kineosporia sp. J2-2]|uniref:Cutinase family protein n=1 Tax=Kineosporia corallincola TaxID=2835133 RepID=A0ABS5TBQ7_9ACTN|nr:cutinase family protein [Kineosporia corallincola]MBT0768471.1 cutinase family protein [Kineosporia corallincola]